MSAAGFGLHQRLAHQDLDAGVIVHIAVADQAVMAMAGIGIERHIAKDADLRHRFLDRAHGAADQIVGIDGFAPVLALEGRIGGGKQRDHRNAQPGGLGGGADREVDAEPVHAGHGGDGLAAVVAVDHKDRPDQIGRRKPVLGHQPPGPVMAAEATQSVCG